MTLSLEIPFNVNKLNLEPVSAYFWHFQLLVPKLYQRKLQIKKREILYQDFTLIRFLFIKRLQVLLRRAKDNEG